MCSSEVGRGPAAAAVWSCGDVELMRLQLTRSASRRAYTSGSSVIDQALSADPPCAIARWKRFRPAAAAGELTSLYIIQLLAGALRVCGTGTVCVTRRTGAPARLHQLISVVRARRQSTFISCLLLAAPSLTHASITLISLSLGRCLLLLTFTTRCVLTPSSRQTFIDHCPLRQPLAGPRIGRSWPWRLPVRRIIRTNCIQSFSLTLNRVVCISDGN